MVKIKCLSFYLTVLSSTNKSIQNKIISINKNIKTLVSNASPEGAPSPEIQLNQIDSISVF